MNELYYSFNNYLKTRFPHDKVRKIPVSAGFPCPNKDGRISNQGCLFCDEYGAGPIGAKQKSISQQIASFIEARPGCKYIAYYQAHCNTYAPLGILRRRYEIIFDFPDVVGLFIGTRPDAIESATYPLFKELQQRTYLSVELGLQSIHEKSLRWLNRNHSYTQFLDTYKRLKSNGIPVIVHLIVGIPGESLEDMKQTISEMNRIQPAGVKIHLLHVLKNTPMEKMYRQNRLPMISLQQYAETVATLLERLDPGIVIHRLTGEREKSLFLAPEWALDKSKTLAAIRGVLKRRGTHQGAGIET